MDGFGEFVREALPGLLRYGHLLTGNPHDAADLVQTVLEKVGSRWSSVVRNRATRWRTRAGRWRTATSAGGGARGASSRSRRSRTCGASHDRDPFENEPLWALLRELPPRQRAVVVLRYYEDLSERRSRLSWGSAAAR